MLVESRSHNLSAMHGMKKLVSSAKLRRDNSNDVLDFPDNTKQNKSSSIPPLDQLDEPAAALPNASVSSDKHQPWTSHFKRGISLRSQSSSDSQQPAAPSAPKRKKVPHGMYGWRWEDELPGAAPAAPIAPPRAGPVDPILEDGAPQDHQLNMNRHRVSTVSSISRNSIAAKSDSSSTHSAQKRKKVPYGMYGWRYADEVDPKDPFAFIPSPPSRANSVAQSELSAGDPTKASSSAPAKMPAAGPVSPRQRKKVPHGMFGWRYADDDVQEKDTQGPLFPKTNNAIPIGNPVQATSQIPTSNIYEADGSNDHRPSETSLLSEAKVSELPGSSTEATELPADSVARQETPPSEKAKPLAIRNIDWSKIDENDMAEFLRAYSSLRTTDSGVAFAELDASARANESSQANEPSYIGKGKGRAIDHVNSSQAPMADVRKDVSDFKGKGKVKIEPTECESDPLDALKDLDLKAKAKTITKFEDYFDEAAELEMRQKAKRLAREQARKEAQQKFLREEQERIFQEELELARKAEEAARYRDCTVCGDSKDPLEYPIKTATYKCDHPSNICVDCMHSWLASEFENKGCDGIKCPECPQALSYADVQRSASVKTFEAYDSLTARNALNASDEFAWCLASGCNSGQLNIDNNSFMDCVTCGYKQCLLHKVPWHTGETCEAYEYRTSGAKAREEERQTEAMLEGISKKCPGEGCGWRIQKLDGCDHMTCRRCRHEFCWSCLAAQKEIRRIGNTAHAKECPYHSHNLDISWPFNAH
ncbi:Hypothetical protein R9X50_00218500 [Acrodontium crateriforme]|uniref:RING-type domain-containing protein n=1 Tax=Acrodontium crateriforme TaxID=150365 RepID=A0AAQ3M6H5_9PEZI|nr:Hypothetical protein R9X50_00218500 [Acrodontium crateriforme]